MTGTSAPARRHRVVVIGSGFGGLFAAQKLKHADVDVTLVSRTSHHLFQPLLYQVATGILSAGEIAPATREVLRDQKNVQVVLGDVVDIDLEKRHVVAVTERRDLELPYDSLIVAAGSGQSYFGNDQFAEFAPGMKSVDDALELRARIFNAFERAELSGQDEMSRALTFVVVGAGPTGVEMAGQIAELARRTLRGEFRNFSSTDARIVLLDAAPKVLPPFHDRLGEHTRRRLEKLGVEVQLNAMVVDMDETGLVVKEKDGSTRRIEAETIMWAAGVSASPLGRLVAERSGAETDRAGRLKVNPDTSVPGHPEVFVVGDMMALDDLPGVAQVAIQSATHATKVIRAGIEGKEHPGDFSYFDKGSMATISRFAAVAEIGRLRLTGFVAWLAWLVIHLFYLIGFKNRLTTLLHWAISFLGRGRTQRAVTHQQIIARNMLNRAQQHDEEHRRVASAGEQTGEAGEGLDADNRVSGVADHG